MVKKYKLTIGSRAQVMHGTAKMTGGGLTKRQLKYNKKGKIVSRKASKAAKKSKNLIKAGYITKKGKFGTVKGGGMIKNKKSLKGGGKVTNKNQKKLQKNNQKLFSIKDRVRRTFPKNTAEQLANKMLARKIGFDRRRRKNIQWAERQRRLSNLVNLYNIGDFVKTKSGVQIVKVQIENIQYLLDDLEAEVNAANITFSKEYEINDIAELKSGVPVLIKEIKQNSSSNSKLVLINTFTFNNYTYNLREEWVNLSNLKQQVPKIGDNVSLKINNVVYTVKNILYVVNHGGTTYKLQSSDIVPDVDQDNYYPVIARLKKLKHERIQAPSAAVSQSPMEEVAEPIEQHVRFNPNVVNRHIPTKKNNHQWKSTVPQWSMNRRVPPYKQPYNNLNSKILYGRK